MALDVKVTISLATPIGKVGSWYPLIYVAKAESEEDAYKEYSDISEVETDYANTTDAYKAASLIFMQDDAPSKIAICRGDATVMTGLAPHMKKGWRQLIVLDDFDETVATAIEAAKDKMYFTHFSSVTALTTAYNKIKDFDRTFCVVYSGTDVTCPEAALVGATAGLVAGSFTYKNIVIKGVTAEELTDTEIKAIHEKGGIVFLEKAGDTVASDGIVASGEYADLIDTEDYVVQNITFKSQKVFNNNKKVAYTDNGIALLEAATLEALKDAYNNGMIADNEDGTPAYSVSFRKRSETSETDRATRHYPYGNFAFTLAGAIHDCEIKGEITL